MLSKAMHLWCSSKTKKQIPLPRLRDRDDRIWTSCPGLEVLQRPHVAICGLILGQVLAVGGRQKLPHRLPIAVLYNRLYPYRRG